jgi:hypothetical protein
VNKRTWLRDVDVEKEEEEEPGLAASVYAMRMLDPYAFPWPVCFLPTKNGIE